MSCKSCSERDLLTMADIDIKAVHAPEVVTAGASFFIYADIKNTDWIWSKYARVCVFIGDESVSDSGSIKMSPLSEMNIALPMVMADEGMWIKVSAVQEDLGFMTTCSDAKDVWIDVATQDNPEIPYSPPVDEPDDPDDPWLPPEWDLPEWELPEWEDIEELFDSTTILIMIAAIALIMILVLIK